MNMNVVEFTIPAACTGKPDNVGVTLTFQM